MPEFRTRQMTAEVERCTPGAVYPATFAEHAARYRLARDIFRGSAQILDVAAGTGIGAELLSREGTSVVGIELSRHALEYAQATYALCRENLAFVRGDVSTLPIRSNSIYAATAFEIIEHLARPDLLLAELHRVLAPGGTLVISTPDASIDRLLLDNPYHISLMSRHEMRARLDSCFRITGEYFQRPVSPVGLARLRKHYRRRRIRGALHLQQPMQVIRALVRPRQMTTPFVAQQTFDSDGRSEDPYVVQPMTKLPSGSLPYVCIFHCVKES